MTKEKNGNEWKAGKKNTKAVFTLDQTKQSPGTEYTKENKLYHKPFQLYVKRWKGNRGREWWKG